MEYLVKIGAHADIGVLRNQFQRAVAGGVEAPGFNTFDSDQGASAPKKICGFIGGAGVQNDNLVCLGHGIHPAMHEVRFIFTDGIHNDFHNTSRCYDRKAEPFGVRLSAFCQDERSPSLVTFSVMAVGT